MMETLYAESLGDKGQTVQTYSLLPFFVLRDHEQTHGCFHHLLTSNSEQFPEAPLHTVLIHNQLRGICSSVCSGRDRYPDHSALVTYQALIGIHN